MELPWNEQRSQRSFGATKALSPVQGFTFLLLSCTFSLLSAAIDPQQLAALSQVVEDLGVPDNIRWPSGGDPCRTWSKFATCDDSQTYVLSLTLNSLGLNGTVPQALGNLTRLTSINLSNNRLSGSIPASIGSLTNLNALSLGLNNLTGSIPVEIGKLGALDSLFLDNNFLSGAIPSSLGNLSRLTALHLYCNGLEGEIPPEIGNLTQVTDFQLHSNKLSGPIPGTLSGLTRVSVARLNDNQLSGALIIPFVAGNLVLLHLHRNNFSGPLPAMNKSSFPVLEDLNFGFNKLTGLLPLDMGSMTSLQYLFLGHNHLEGPIPGSYANLESLKVLDVSHNRLSGSLAAVSTLGLIQQEPEFDFSFNDLVLSNVPPSLIKGNNTLFNCLPSSASQQPAGATLALRMLAEAGAPAPAPSSSSSCSRYVAGGNSEMAINAGGLQDVPNNDNLVYQADSHLLQNVTTGIQAEACTGNWAVQVSGKDGGTFTASADVAKNIDNSLLYQSMRWSSDYLAYFGRNMRLGIYHVRLHFAELNFKLPGYRVFDVVVQGDLIRASLDVVAIAGSNTAYVIDLPEVAIEDGLLRIELIQVSPINRYIDPSFRVQDTGPMISALSVTPVELTPYDPASSPGTTINSCSITSPSSSKKSASRIVKVVLAVLGSLLGALIVTVLAFRYFIRRHVNRPSDPPAGSVAKSVRAPGRNSSGTQGSATPDELSDIGPTFYTYQELSDATDGFREENKLGQGGFGAVYKGVLADGSIVAVKQLMQETQQSREAFRKEIAIISSVQHRNLLNLRGCCLEIELPLLVCEYMPNGSLDKLLHGRDSKNLDWESRRNIAIGAACGLAYLHDESKHRIIHCDVKPANILLDKDFNARIADFGLARLYDEGHSHITATKIQGTRGYLAPEYALHLQLSEKADVYSFGIVLLELLSGRRIVEPRLPSDKVVLVDWAQELGQQGPSALLQLVDSRLKAQQPEEEQLVDMATIANWCTQTAPNLRPKMRTVWLMLNGTIKIPDLPSRRQSKVETVKAILSVSSALPMPVARYHSDMERTQASPNARSSTSHTTASSSSSGAAARFVEHEETQIANLLSRDGSPSPSHTA